MRQILLAATVLLSPFLANSASARDEAPLWLRYPAISPSGEQIVFTYGGDLYLVPTGGGEAVHLIQHPAHDYLPVWAPDGKSVAFASDRFGNFDVYQASTSGGRAKRLTFHSASDSPSGFHPDGKSILVSSVRQDSAQSIGFPSRSQPELYSVGLDGKLPSQILTTPAEDAVYNPAGTKIAYHDKKGFENAWRKHHTSSIARDLWIYDVESKRHEKVTHFEGEDRNPVWGKDDTLYYLSEKSGSFNVWKKTGKDLEQLTRFKFHPLRFLTSSKEGILCFSYHGEIYTLDTRKGGNAQPEKVAIRIRTGAKANERKIVSVSGGATGAALSPNGRELAFIVRGEVFVTSLDHSSTKRITNTPQQERSVSFSPDGRSLLYASERGESWNLYTTTLARENEKYFHLSTLLTEEAVLETEAETFQPSYSPDGKEVAFLEERTTLRVLNLESKRIRTVLPGNMNYSYRDGDISYAWSPDSRWILSTFINSNRWNEDIALIDTKPDDKAKDSIVNLSKSGYFHGSPQWAMNGKVILWVSDRHGMRSHGSWGSQEDVYATFLTQDAYDRFRLSKEEYALLKEEDGDKKKKKKKKEKEEEEKEEEKKKNDPKKKEEQEEEKNKQKGEKEKPAPEPVEIEWEGLDDRKARLTIHSSALGGAVLSPDGESLYYLSQFEGGYDLWVQKFYDRETKLLSKFPKTAGGRDAGPIKLIMDEKGKTLVVLSGGSLYKIDTAKPDQKKRVDTGSEMEVRQAEEHAYMFEHAWRQLKKKFYVKDLHGVDWDFYKREYTKFLPHINNNYDFAELLSEMLGELNASHTGSGHRARHTNGDATAMLGIFADPDHQGPGIRILEIIDKSPMRQAKSKARPGVIIEKIDGNDMPASFNYFPLLNRRAGKRTLLSLKDPASGEQWEEVVKPISQGAENGLLYERWVKSRREAAHNISKGRIGYVHVQSMNDASYRETFSKVLGPEHEKEALVVDTRFNGGGWLHDHLVTFLSGKDYIQFYPRGQDNMGSEPMFKWSKPSAVIMGEGNYSDAHMFPYAYKTMKVGKLVGMPVPGTGTAVWWETQIDPTIYFGIPQVGMRTPDGKLLENTQLEPDIKVRNLPEDVAAGRDRQLEAAIKHLLK